MTGFYTSFLITLLAVVALATVLFGLYRLTRSRFIVGSTWSLLLVFGVLLNILILHDPVARSLLMAVLVALIALVRVAVTARHNDVTSQMRPSQLRQFLSSFLAPAVLAWIALIPLIVVAATPYDLPLGTGDILAGLILIAGLGLSLGNMKYDRTGRIVSWWALYIIASMTSYGFLTFFSPLVLSIVIAKKNF